MKKYLSLILLLTFAISLFACTEAKIEYKTDADVNSVADAMVAVCSNGLEMTEMDSDFVGYYVDSDISSVSSYTIRMQVSGTEIDEIGVFKSDGSDAAKTVVEEYLNSRLDNWNPDYLKEEYPKMQAAEYRIYGDYVVYAILSQVEKATVFKAAEDMLKVK